MRFDVSQITSGIQWFNKSDGYLLCYTNRKFETTFGELVGISFVLPFYSCILITPNGQIDLGE